MGWPVLAFFRIDTTCPSVSGVSRIKRLRKELGLRCVQMRQFKVTTHLNHPLPVAENVLAQTFLPTRPNEMWVADLTYGTPSQRSPPVWD